MYYLTGADYKVAEANGIPRDDAYNRYYRCGWDKERALTEPVGTYVRVTPNMKAWEEWKEVAKKNKITKEMFFNRLNRKKKMTPEDAATRPKGYRVGGTISPEIYALAEKNGIPKTTLRNRIFRQKWRHYRAATEPVNNKSGVLVW